MNRDEHHEMLAWRLSPRLISNPERAFEKLVNYFEKILKGSLTPRPDPVLFNAAMMVLVYKVH